MKKETKKLKLLLLSVILLILGIIVGVAIGYRRILNKDTALGLAIQTKANISIGKFHQTATRNGVKEWSLDARTAQVINAKKQALFQDLSVTFFLKNNANVYLTADQGILNTESNDIEVSGNVVLQNDRYRLKTETLNYKHKQRLLYSEVPVKIMNQSSQLRADSMSYYLNTNRTVLKGNIKGVFGEHFIL